MLANPPNLPKSEARCPFAHTFEDKRDDFDPSAHDDPDEIRKQYAHLRDSKPVAYTSAYGGYHLLTRYSDIKAAATNAELFISSVKAVVPSDPRGLRRAPLNFDAPAHTPYRRALERTIKPARIKKLEGRLEVIAERELLEWMKSGDEDICSGFAAIFPAYVEALWLNLDEGIAPKLATTASQWVIAWRDQRREDVSRYSQCLYDIARDLLDDRRQNPRDPEEDPASSLLQERLNGQPLEDEHLLGCLRQSLVVGMVAPPILLGAICKHLSEHQDLQEQLRDDPTLIPAAVEEFVRLYSPYRGFARTVSKEITLHGRTIKPTEPITMTYASANRDPAVFPDPDEFILHRENITAHLGFGRGRHACVGMPLARMAIQVAVRTLLANTKSFKMNGPCQFARMPELGVTSCPLEVVPAE